MAFQPGVVLWDHLNFAFEHDELRTWIEIEEIIEDPKLHQEPFALQEKARADKQIRSLFRELLIFCDRDPADAALQRPRTVALVEELVGRYERREFCDNLLWHWDAAKSDL